MNYRTISALALAVLFIHGCDSNSGSSSNEINQSTASPTAPTEPTAPTFAAVDDERLVAAASEPGQWLTHGGTYKEQRYSQLDQINTENISELGLAWFADLNTNRGQQSTPIMVDGAIYVTESWSKVSAYNAKTGERLWHYNPKVAGERGGMGCCDVVNRGVAVYKGKGICRRL